MGVCLACGRLSSSS